MALRALALLASAQLLPAVAEHVDRLTEAERAQAISFHKALSSLGTKAVLLADAARHELGVVNSKQLPDWFAGATQGLLGKEADFLGAEDNFAGALLRRFAQDAMHGVLKQTADRPAREVPRVAVPSGFQNAESMETFVETSNGRSVRTVRRCQNGECTTESTEQTELLVPAETPAEAQKPLVAEDLEDIFKQRFQVDGFTMKINPAAMVKIQFTPEQTAGVLDAAGGPFRGISRSFSRDMTDLFNNNGLDAIAKFLGLDRSTLGIDDHAEADTEEETATIGAKIGQSIGQFIDGLIPPPDKSREALDFLKHIMENTTAESISVVNRFDETGRLLQHGRVCKLGACMLSHERDLLKDMYVPAEDD